MGGEQEELCLNILGSAYSQQIIGFYVYPIEIHTIAK